MDKISNIFSKILPIYWAFLTYMLLRPGIENTDYWFVFHGFDKVTHIAIFIVLGFSYKCAFPKTRFLTFLQIMLIYALATEILQQEMRLGRSLETLDLVADTVGVVLGYLLYQRTKSFML